MPPFGSDNSQNHFQRQGWKNPDKALQIGYVPETDEYERVILDSQGRLLVVITVGPVPSDALNLTLKGSIVITDTPTLIAPANADRNYLLFVNQGLNTIYVGDGSVTAAPAGATPNGGIGIPPGAGMSFDPLDDGSAIYAVCSTGLTSVVARREITNS